MTLSAAHQGVQSSPVSSRFFFFLFFSTTLLEKCRRFELTVKSPALKLVHKRRNVRQTVCVCVLKDKQVD